MTTRTRNKPLDLVETAHKMLDAAAAVTTGRLHLASPEEAVRHLKDGDPLAVYYFRHELARQIAGALLMMDSCVVAVFEDREGGRSGAYGLSDPLRLWVQVTYCTAALKTVIAALDEALGQAHEDLFGQPVSPVIKAIIVDAHDDGLLRAGITSFAAPVLLAHRS